MKLSFVSQTCCDHIRQRAEAKIADIEPATDESFARQDCGAMPEQEFY